VVVTGGASGIGEATVRALVGEGCKVLVADLQQEPGEALAAELGPSVCFQRTDVTREEDIVAAIEVAQERFGPLTGMVNNAGIVGAVGSITETSAEDFDRTMSILSRAVFLGLKHAGRVMQERGKGAIVSLASTAGVTGGLGPHVYTMAKHGVVGLTKTAAIEYAKQNIRVNSVCPGYIETDMNKTAMELRGDEILKLVPYRRMGIPSEIAEMVCWLCSDRASYASGGNYNVDGGYVAQ